MSDEVVVESQGETPNDESKVINLPSFDEIAAQFQDEVIPVIQTYARKLPMIFMVKILQNLTTDLVFQNATFVARKTAEGMKESMENRSKIITV